MEKKKKVGAPPKVITPENRVIVRTITANEKIWLESKEKATAKGLPMSRLIMILLSKWNAGEINT